MLLPIRVVALEFEQNAFTDFPTKTVNDHATVVVFLLLELVSLISLYPESKKGAPCSMGRM